MFNSILSWEVSILSTACLVATANPQRKETGNASPWAVTLEILVLCLVRGSGDETERCLYS